MFEFHVGKFRGNVDRGIHVAERSRENQLVARQRHLGHDPLGVRAFGYALDVGRLHPITQRIFNREPALVVLVTPAEVTDRSDVDESDLEFFVRRKCCTAESDGECRGADKTTPKMFHGDSLHK